MRPVLQIASDGEIAISDAVQRLENEFDLTDEERRELLPSGKQTRFANRVHWARSYLKQAGLVENPRRGHFAITETGRDVLSSGDDIDARYLERFEPFREFRDRGPEETPDAETSSSDITPDEQIELAHGQIIAALSAALLDHLKRLPPAFFEELIVELLQKMGYGDGDEAGSVLGGSGDGGVDGVINQDPLGVDQLFVQAKRYADTNPVGSAAIRDFFGALSLKDVSSGIFFTTSRFSPSAKQTAEKLNVRMVLIDGPRLARLMIAHEVGCRVEKTYAIPVLDAAFFDVSED